VCNRLIHSLAEPVHNSDAQQPEQNLVEHE
jgi:hypothetical protein